MNLQDSKELISIVRKTIENYFSNQVGIEKTKFKEKKGIFVSIHSYPDHKLRGCIGFPYPILELGEAVQKAAISAGFKDPRFPPLEKKEMDKIVFEISILTKLEPVDGNNQKEYAKKIKIGEDGLIIIYGHISGLLLPQVPVEYKWSVEKFLEQLCFKAGLDPNILTNPNVKIYKFQCQIFEEKTPNGKVIEKNINRT